MLFRDFVKYLRGLEETSSRIAIAGLLSRLIGDMAVDEVRLGMYLVLGKIGPDFDNIEFGMAAKMVMRAVAVASGDKTEKLEKMYKKIGDLGEMVEQMDLRVTAAKSSVNDVYTELKSLANDVGEGSQDRKVARLAKLLVSMTGEERRYLVRMVLGKLRLGFTEKTIFDALSQLRNGDRTLRKEIDRVFQIYPDVGLIVKVIKEKGLDGLKNVKVKTGVPVVPALCQRLNEYQDMVEKMGEVAVEKKYDGTRVQIHFNKQKNEVLTYTRNLENSSQMFPELVGMKKWVEADQIILDCEAVGYDKMSGKILSFQMTITRKRKHGVEEVAKAVPLRFFVFDVLSLNGEDLLDKPYAERREILKKVIKANEVLQVNEYWRTKEAKEVKALHDGFLKEGLEGAVIKKWGGRYLPGRQGWNWVKIKEAAGTTGKLADTFDLVVLGYYYGRGKRTRFGIGAFLAGLKKQGKWVSVAKVGTGLTDEEFRGLRQLLDRHKIKMRPEDYLVDGVLVPDVWVEPEVVVEIAADEVTKSPVHAGGSALRFPRLIRVRSDKGPRQATTWEEMKVIAKLATA